MKKHLPKRLLERTLELESEFSYSGNNGEPEDPIEDRAPEFVPFSDKLLSHTILPYDELVRLIKRFQKRGDAEALERIVRHNLRFIAVLAKPYQEFGLEFWDLIHEGVLGLVIAAQRFDPKRGAKFHTYAGFWVRQHLIRATHKKGHTIRVPIGARRLRSRIFEVAGKIAEKTGTDPSLSRIAKKLHLPVEAIEMNLRGAMDSPLSLNIERQYGHESSYTLLDKIPDLSAPEPFAEVEKRFVSEGLEKALSELSPRERRVIEMRFGLNGQERQTLADIGRITGGVTRERIRQIEAKALRKLRHKSRCCLLTDNFGEMPIGIPQPAVNSRLTPAHVFSAVYWCFRIRSEEFQRLRKAAPEGTPLQVAMFLLVMDAELSPQEVVGKLQLRGVGVVRKALTHVRSLIKRDSKIRDKIAKIRSRYFGSA